MFSAIPGIEEWSALFDGRFPIEGASFVVLPVPWDLTSTYFSGSRYGPEAIMIASNQLDLYHPHYPDLIENECIAYIPPNDEFLKYSVEYRRDVVRIMDLISNGEEPSAELYLVRRRINDIHEAMNQWIQDSITDLLKDNRQVILLGGDHSVSLGYIRAVSQAINSFGILQIDAHMDLREAYQGFTYSHASVMYNALGCKEVKRLVQVGVRDISHEEMDLAKNSKGRICVFHDTEIREALYSGKTWQSIVRKIVNSLPKHVYVSIDVDGFDPSLAPHTGTPVPGGLSFEEWRYLMKALVDSGRHIVGADLVEVAPGKREWDGNVGARLLYSLMGYYALSWPYENA